MSKILKIMVIALLVMNLALFFGAGCAVGIKAPPSSTQSLDIVEEAWNIIFKDYVDRDKLDETKLSQGAVRGMVEAVDDPYTAFLDPATYQLSVTVLEGTYEGIGATVSIKDDQLMIIAPITGSPAEKAGIRPGDKILEIDGASTEGMSLVEAVVTIRGRRGTSVRLLVLHQDETEPEEIEVVRAEIELPSVRYEMREDIAYINLSHFSELTDGQLSSVMESITHEAATGIILDLRSNPGGLLPAVVDVASYFLTDGVVVDVVDNEGGHTTMAVRRKGVTTDLPLVILVDSYSSSGSEVLAGALQDHGRAIIAGTITYGKGSVNVLRQLKDGSGLYITTARWLTPQGRLIEGEGISPDYEFELEEEDAIQWAIAYLKASK
jgi:carboxyl-terminal processing protease